MDTTDQTSDTTVATPPIPNLLLIILPSSSPSMESINEPLTLALTSLRNLIPKHVPPVIFTSQLYSIIKNNTIVDREIDLMCKSGTLRRFRLRHNKHSVMMMNDYLDQINCALNKDIDNNKNNDKEIKSSLYDRYHNFIASAIHDSVDITKNILVDELLASDDDISKLLNLGFLTHKSLSEYTISFRNAGSFWTLYQRGRSQIINWIKRKQFKQVLDSQLKVKKFGWRKDNNTTILPWRLIVADLLGCEYIEAEGTPMGTMYKLTKKADASGMSGATLSSWTFASSST